MLTIIACMIPVEYIKLDPLQGARRNYQDEFENLYLAYCCQPNEFNRFTSYLKNAKLFAGVNGEIDLREFQ